VPDKSLEHVVDISKDFLDVRFSKKSNGLSKVVFTENGDDQEKVYDDVFVDVPQDPETSFWGLYRRSKPSVS